jgi:hypothetical protein
MNTTLIVAIAHNLAKLTPQEHLIASELAQKLRVGDKPSPVVETPKQEDAARFDWSVGDRLALIQQHMQFESVAIQSPEQRRQLRERLAKLLGCKDVKVVANKIGKLRKQETQ